MITGRTMVAGVVGQPVAQSLSPILHNAWLAAAGIDGIYVSFAPQIDGFARFAEGLRGGAKNCGQYGFLQQCLSFALPRSTWPF